MFHQNKIHHISPSEVAVVPRFQTLNNVCERKESNENVSFLVPPPLIPCFINQGPPTNFNPTVNYANNVTNAMDLNNSTNSFIPLSKGIINTKKSFNKLLLSHVNVTSVKKEIKKCFILMKECESLLNILKVFKKTLSEEEWLNKCEEMKSKEVNITTMLKKYENSKYFVRVKSALRECAKKRMYRKRKIKEWQKIKKINKSFREREHKRIDVWLQNMRDQTDKSLREEHVMKQADLVLSDVTTKKSEAKRFINLLNTLTKLRNARVQQLTNSGNIVDENYNKTFTIIADKLKNLWIDQLKEYNVEEQGLRVMLNNAEVKRINVETKVNRDIQKKWYKLLFGDDEVNNSISPTNLDEFIAVRREWDRFVTIDGGNISSQIPFGWMVPVEPYNADWARFLQK